MSARERVIGTLIMRTQSFIRLDNGRQFELWGMKVYGRPHVGERVHVIVNGDRRTLIAEKHVKH